MPHHLYVDISGNKEKNATRAIHTTFGVENQQGRITLKHQYGNSKDLKVQSPFENMIRIWSSKNIISSE